MNTDKPSRNQNPYATRSVTGETPVPRLGHAGSVRSQENPICVHLCSSVVSNLYSILQPGTDGMILLQIFGDHRPPPGVFGFARELCLDRFHTPRQFLLLRL